MTKSQESYSDELNIDEEISLVSSYKEKPLMMQRTMAQQKLAQ